LAINVNYITSYPILVENIKNINVKKMCSGIKHTLLIDNNLNLYSIGFNDVNLIINLV
jgi:alpha-tubulin suppressor-like RCC1 family protein